MNNMELTTWTLLLAMLVCSAVAQQADTEAGKVRVRVLYESLCPDSQKFFTTQLYPAVQGNISDHISLTLIPFGKSTQNWSDSTKQWTFTCHHGPDECYGNMVHACAMVHIMSPKQDATKLDRLQLAFINCLMAKATRNPFKMPIRECAELNQVQDIDAVEKCANSTEGNQLLSKLGQLTNAISPNLKSVPTIVVNTQYSDDNQHMALSNFQKLICSTIDKNDRPAECLGNSNSSASLYFSPLVAIFPALLITLKQF